MIRREKNLSTSCKMKGKYDKSIARGSFQSTLNSFGTQAIVSRGMVFAEKHLVHLPCCSALVDTAEKCRGCSDAMPDNPSLAMDQPKR